MHIRVTRVAITGLDVMKLLFRNFSEIISAAVVFFSLNLFALFWMYAHNELKKAMGN